VQNSKLSFRSQSNCVLNEVPAVPRPEYKESNLAFSRWSILHIDCINWCSMMVMWKHFPKTLCNMYNPEQTPMHDFSHICFSMCLFFGGNDQACCSFLIVIMISCLTWYIMNGCIGVKWRCFARSYLAYGCIASYMIGYVVQTANSLFCGPPWLYTWY
jgi:hypothetical protein